MSVAGEVVETDDLAQFSRAELEQQVIELQAENASLREERDEITAERDEFRETIADLQSELDAKDGQIQTLIATLRQYENANNPSNGQWPPTDGSADTDGDGEHNSGSDNSSSATDDDDEESSPEQEEDESEKTRGRKPGHEPAWHDFDVPDEVVEVLANSCSCCGAALDDDHIYCVEPHYVEEIPDLDPIITTLYLRSHYECSQCGETTAASSENCPAEGQFGDNVLARAALLKAEYRLPYQKIADLFDQLHDLSISSGSVFHATERVARAGRDEYEQIRDRIRQSEVIYIDETGMSLDGDQGWIWAFTTPEETLYVVAESRGSTVLEEVLGEDLDEYQVIVSDGWSAYRGYDHSNRQRCWAHLLREAAFLATHYDDAVPIFRNLWQLFESLQAFLETDPSPEQRTKVTDRATAAMEDLLTHEYENEELQKFQTKIERGMGHWFTFVEYPHVEPTNNRAENAIRKAVIHRKIMRTLRSESGEFTFETLLSLLVTWDQQDRNGYEELQRVVSSSKNV
jgi:transposase